MLICDIWFHAVLLQQSSGRESIESLLLFYYLVFYGINDRKLFNDKSCLYIYYIESFLCLMIVIRQHETNGHR